jgi:hypothetical protein
VEDDIINVELRFKEYEELYNLEREFENNKPDLKLVQGLGGGDPPDRNWLQELNPGAIFTCRSRQGIGNPIIEFEVLYKYPNGDVKMINDTNEPHVTIIVPSLEFSRANHLRSLSCIGKETIDE